MMQLIFIHFVFFSLSLGLSYSKMFKQKIHKYRESALAQQKPNALLPNEIGVLCSTKILFCWIFFSHAPHTLLHYTQIRSRALSFFLSWMDHTESAHCHWEREPINITYYSPHTCVAQLASVVQIKSEWKERECEWEKLPFAFNLIKIQFNYRIRKTEFALFTLTKLYRLSIGICCYKMCNHFSWLSFFLSFSHFSAHFYYTVAVAATSHCYHKCVCVCVALCEQLKLFLHILHSALGLNMYLDNISLNESKFSFLKIYYRQFSIVPHCI